MMTGKERRITGPGVRMSRRRVGGGNEDLSLAFLATNGS
jgi:hypothetical protein